MRHGPPLAKPAAMPDEKTVRLVKQYDRPDFRAKLNPNKTTLRSHVDLQVLHMEIAELKDQRRRLREEIESTIKMLTQAIEEGKEETVEQVKRRISRLKGSLEYRGRWDFSER
jgi:flagellar biosynthesis/type III secretory pathway protein FliH